MRTLARLVPFALALSCVPAVSGCAADSDDDDASSSVDALTSLTAAQCKTPTVHTAPKADPSGNAVQGSAHTTLSGCVLGASGESGEAVLGRLAALLANTSALGTVQNDQGARVFQRFVPGPKHGTLATSLTQDIDVTLAMTGSPKTSLHTVQKRAAGKPLSLSIANATPVVASLAIFSVTVVKPGNLSLALEIKAQENGITVTGASDVVLEQQQDKAAQAAVLVNDVFRWLTTELKKTQPPPGRPSSNDAGAGG
jgi:hypothetical protein